MCRRAGGRSPSAVFAMAHCGVGTPLFRSSHEPGGICTAALPHLSVPCFSGRYFSQSSDCTALPNLSVAHHAHLERTVLPRDIRLPSTRRLADDQPYVLLDQAIPYVPTDTLALGFRPPHRAFHLSVMHRSALKIP